MYKFTFSKKQLKENYQITTIYGKHLFFCDRLRFLWYVNHPSNLADQISDKVAKLNFEPNGPGQTHPYYATAELNRCVVCASEDQLTRHHVVPRCYKRFMPPLYKFFNSHDVLVMCAKHHGDYELLAKQFKLQICAQYDVPWDGIGLIRHFNTLASKNANTLLRYGDQIPMDRKTILENQIKEETKITEINKETLEKIIRETPYGVDKTHYRPHGQLVMEKITNVYDFCVMWRKHFLEHTNPQYLPPLWSVYYDPAYNREEYANEC